MAGDFFKTGEQKKRPGIYQRYEKSATSLYAGAQDGVVAAVVMGNWGELGKVHVVESIAQLREVYGTGAHFGMIEEIFNGGALKVLMIRVGTGGTKSTAALKDAASAAAVSIEAKCQGDRAFKYLLRLVAGSMTRKEFVLLEGGTILERIRFEAGEGTEADALIKAGATSRHLTFTKESGYTGTGELATIATETAMTAGTQPTVTASQYSAAFEQFEPYRYNAICVDTNDTAVHALLAAHKERTYQEGKTGFAVIGEPISVDLYDRQTHAATYNRYTIVYVGDGWYDANGALIDGYMAAARIAGVIAATPSSQAITRTTIVGAVDVAEKKTNAQQEACIDSGMVTVSESPSGAVWVEVGITTLTNPSDEDDEGWKKIKRTKVRFEVFDRVDDSIAFIIGKVNNDVDGRAAVIQLAKGVLLEMIREKKIEADAEIIEDPAHPAAGDSAWFVIGYRDIDALEKVYLVYKIGGFAPKA